MPPTLFLEAFGQLSPGTNLIDSEEEDLYSVFRTRGELMNWSTTSVDGSPTLWGLEEAELTAGDDDSRIGWVQVGLGTGIGGVLKAASDLSEPRLSFAAGGGRAGFGRFPGLPSTGSTEPAVVMPALVQCFDDALRRFGVVELSGLQVTASYLEPSTRSATGGVFSALNWFNIAPKEKVVTLIAFDNELLGGHSEEELLANLPGVHGRPFKFGPVAAVSEQHRIKTPVEAPLHYYSISPATSGLGLSVTLPEWTASAVGWALAAVIDGARAIAPDVPEFTIRITRVG